MGMYTVSGRWQARDGWQTFEKEIEAENIEIATERTYAEFGSKHGLKRRQIEIDEARSAADAEGEGVEA